MSDTQLPDYYEVLQISPNADSETVERVFRHLANRYHPDNRESGDSDRFTGLVDAHNILSDPEKRAKYDVSYDSLRQERWRIFNQDSTTSEIVSDTRIRLALLSLLYVARRNNAREPGMGPLELERILGCSGPVLEFHLWYLKENGWVQRLDTGLLAITAPGVDRLFDLGGPPRTGPHLLQPGDAAERETGAA
ncbi:MAG: J domain-containing protein [Gemmatimonadaceae bacterium]